MEAAAIASDRAGEFVDRLHQRIRRLIDRMVDM
jgi:hypothetical protein